MSEYFRSLGVYAAMFVITFTIAGFVMYYSDVSSLKQDTYKDFMYSAMNKSALRMQGAEPLANGAFDAYYLDSDGTYQQLNYEMTKQIALASKTNEKIEYEIIRNIYTNEYYLHIESSDVDSVIKFVLEDGRE